MTTNCIIMNMPKAPTEPVTGKITTLTTLKTTWKTTGRSKLPFVLLRNQVMKNVVGTMKRKFMIKYTGPYWLRVPIRIQKGMCHVAHKRPRIVLIINEEYLFWRAGKATRRQPISSPSEAIVRKMIFAINPPREIDNRFTGDCASNR